MEIRFTYDGKKFITVATEDKSLPQTIIRCEETENEKILKICQDWLAALSLEKVEYHVDVRLH